MICSQGQSSTSLLGRFCSPGVDYEGLPLVHYIAVAGGRGDQPVQEIERGLMYKGHEVGGVDYQLVG